MLSLKCGFCGIAATMKCGGCKTVFYCGKEHQKMDWKKTHKIHCKSYSVNENAQVGRFVQAIRDIKCGEIIIRERPLVFGPKIISTPICLGCNRSLSPQNIVLPAKDRKSKPQIVRNYFKCSKCKWPLCSEACERSTAHTAECALMAAKKFQCSVDYNPDDEHKKESAYCAILPLRCLLLSQTDPNGYKKFMQLEDHLADRMQTPVYAVLKSNLLTFFKTILSLDEFDETTILKAAAILDINAFELRLSERQSKIRAIYLDSSMISHDCVPNAYHVFDENMEIYVIAAVDITKGDAITVSYGQPLQSTLSRRTHLRQSKCFDCVCQRCSDATECGTYAGSLLCPRCKSAKLVTNNPLSDATEWRCEQCTMQLSAPHMSLVLNRLQFEVENLPKHSPYDLELFLEKYCLRRNGANGEVLLHATNTFVLQIKYALTQLYGNVSGFLFDVLNDSVCTHRVHLDKPIRVNAFAELGETDLERKISLSKELLEIAEVLEPGKSLFRAKLLLDLLPALMCQTRAKLQNGIIDKHEAKDQCDGIKEMLNECMAIVALDANTKPIIDGYHRKLQRQLDELQSR